MEILLEKKLKIIYEIRGIFYSYVADWGLLTILFLIRIRSQK